MYICKSFKLIIISYYATWKLSCSDCYISHINNEIDYILYTIKKHNANTLTTLYMIIFLCNILKTTMLEISYNMMSYFQLKYHVENQHNSKKEKGPNTK